MAKLTENPGIYSQRYSSQISSENDKPNTQCRAQNGQNAHKLAGGSGR